VSAFRNDAGLGGRDLSLTATSFATLHSTVVHTTSGTPDCGNVTFSSPIEGDFGGRVIYLLGDLGPGQSKTVTVTYRRL
jgi:hypothetical protein